ncbi:sulfite exporter TauE/SafE family protein [Tessaracoccus antarcticus]|uniref:Probable membrane transporter protein n=1 Tax=Tessaracoccus antarcticus TaxID=2479848 RepID=A0A3M0G610_9ACTN|nr:sulfite exporter TauE/SafE family protein [Tessaracoccus antarcticus]RMB59998.1 sulfite exporter TauE/SafE family protein [Tessaracoccus antarcticus]
MKKLILIGIVGLLAQLVDGALGMGYGVTSSSLLLFVGLTPAMASASVHLAEVGTNVVSGVSHWKLGNVDWRLVLRLGVPGAVGAFAGATFLSNLSTGWASPLMASLLAVLGAYILIRFAFRPPRVATARRTPHTYRFLVPLGLVGGFVDATGGGGWGPVSTTSLLSAGKTAPRTVVGSVDTSEFLVSLAASMGFLAALGTSGIQFSIVGVLLLGGVIAAPVAAWLVSRLPARVLGTAVGGLIVITNLRTLLGVLGAGTTTQQLVLVVVALAWVALVTHAVRAHRRRPADVEALEPETELV